MDLLSQSILLTLFNSSIDSVVTIDVTLELLTGSVLLCCFFLADRPEELELEPSVEDFSVLMFLFSGMLLNLEGKSN